MIKTIFLMLNFFAISSYGTMRLLTDYLTEKDLLQNPNKNVEISLTDCSVKKGSKFEFYCADLMRHVVQSNCLDKVTGPSIKLDANNSIKIKVFFLQNEEEKIFFLKDVRANPDENKEIEACFAQFQVYKPKKFLKYKNEFSIDLEMAYVKAPLK